MIRGGTLELSQRDDEVRILRIEVAELQRSIGATMKVRRGGRGGTGTSSYWGGGNPNPFWHIAPAVARRGRGAAAALAPSSLNPTSSPLWPDPLPPPPPQVVTHSAPVWKDALPPPRISPPPSALTPPPLSFLLLDDDLAT